MSLKAKTWLYFFALSETFLLFFVGFFLVNVNTFCKQFHKSMVYSGSRPSRWCSYEEVPAARVIEQEFLSFYFLLLLEVVFLFGSEY